VCQSPVDRVKDIVCGRLGLKFPPRPGKGAKMQALELWNRCFADLGLPAPAGEEFNGLTARYLEPHRAYHTMQHIEECEFDVSGNLAQSRGLVGLALFYHDAIYDTRAHDNEEKSADLASRVLDSVGAVDTVKEDLRQLILVTRHAAAPETVDQQLVVDIDLSILGAPEARFDEYERQVRQEYSWVEESFFRAVRAGILKEFLSHPFIYNTTPYRDRLEVAARGNLSRSIQKLSA